MDVVYGYHALPATAEHVKQPHDRPKQSHLARFGKIRRQCGQIGKALGNGRNQRGDLGERDRRELLQHRVRAQIDRLSHQVNDRLIRHCTLDLVAIAVQRADALRARITCDLLQQPAFADARLSLDQDYMTCTGRHASEQADQLPEFIAATDEWGAIVHGGRIRSRGIARIINACRGFLPISACGAGSDRLRIDLQLIRRSDCTRGIEERIALGGWYGEALSETLRETAGWTALIGFDLADGETRAAYRLPKLFLRQIERLAAPPQPIAKRVRPLIHARPSSFIGIVAIVILSLSRNHLSDLWNTSNLPQNVPLFVTQSVPLAVTGASLATA